MMQASRWHNRLPHSMLVPGMFVLGGVVVGCLRGNAGQQNTAQPPIQPPAQVLSLQSAFEQVAEKMRPSVVHIRSRQSAKNTALRGLDDGANPFGDILPFGRQFRMMPRRAEASGSGVIVRSDGYILTNDHVIAGADKVTVRLQDGREYPGTVKRDQRSDLAVIKINATGLPAAQLADSDRVKVGQWAMAFGSPFGLSDTMTVGVISALHRSQAIGMGTDGRYYPSLIQTDASINPGNSGGPLVDIYGRVVGINVAIESPSGGNVGIGFAIPANTATYIMDQLIKNGSVTRGYLGLSPTRLTPDLQEQLNVKNGVLVTEVQDGTPAAQAGFQPEDVITRYNTRPVLDEAQFRDMVAKTEPGKQVPVVVRRNGADKTLQVTVGKAPDLTVAQQVEPAKEMAKGKLGIAVANLADAEIRTRFKLKDDLKAGAVVTEVAPGGPAQEAGLMPGDVVTRLNGKEVATAEDLGKIAAELKDGSNVTVVIRRGTFTRFLTISLE